MLARRSLSVLKEGIEERIFSGAAYALVSKRASGGVGTLGRLAFERETDRVNRDARFDIASLTKPLATAMAIAQLADRGALSFDDSIEKYLGPRPGLAAVRIVHLLTHTSGLPAIPPGTESDDSADPLAAALDTAPAAVPGASYLYSDTGFVLLGEIVRRAGGRSLDAWFASEIALPLHLNESGFQPDIALPIVASSADESLDGQPHDPRSRSMGGVAGHAGLFASINDIAAYIRALLGSGRALISDGALFEQLFASRLDPAVGAHSLAFFCKGNPLLPDIAGFSERGVGHSGFTGCFLMIDRLSQTGCALLTNRVLGQAGHDDYLALRRRWLEAAAIDLGLAASADSGPLRLADDQNSGP